MRNTGLSRSVAFMALLLAAIACGSLAPPESCGEGLAGTADEATFNRYFSEMVLVRSDTGAPGADDPDRGSSFESGSVLAVRSVVTSEVTLRICIQERTGGGVIPFDRTQDLAPGANSFHLGIFPSGMYVARVIVNGTLARNLTFFVE